MYDKNKLLDEIMIDWEYKVSNGMPDINNSEHRMILKDVLKEHGLTQREIGMIIQNLTGEKQLLIETDPLSSITSTAFIGRDKTHVTGSGHQVYIDPYQVQNMLPKQDTEEEEEELKDDGQDTTIESYYFDQDHMKIMKTGNSISIEDILTENKFKCFMTGEIYYETKGGTLVKEADLPKNE